MTRSRDVADTQDNLGGAVAPFVAGKNKIINGDFGIWQRGTSFAGLTANQYTADRWYYHASGATATVTREAFTPGTAPVAGYESSYFARVNATVANDLWGVQQRIEDVRTFAGQTATLSFWAKTNAVLTINTQFEQGFGSGGSSNVTTSSQTATSTTSWARYSFTYNIPSISGKTIGTSNWLAVFIRIADNTTGTLDVWGVQVEAGSVATAFQTATGTLQGELAACQRYYQTLQGGQYFDIGLAAALETTQASTYIYIPTMRSAPSCTWSGTVFIYIDGSIFYPSSYTVGSVSPNMAYIRGTTSGMTRGQTGRLTGHTTPFNLQMSAEL